MKGLCKLLLFFFGFSYLSMNLSYYFISKCYLLAGGRDEKELLEQEGGGGLVGRTEREMVLLHRKMYL